MTRPAPWQMEENAAAFDPDQHVGERAHRAGDQHQLASGTQVRWKIRMTRRKHAGGAIAVHARQCRFPVHLVEAATLATKTARA
jgi:hypothetical protein